MGKFYCNSSSCSAWSWSTFDNADWLLNISSYIKTKGNDWEEQERKTSEMDILCRLISFRRVQRWFRWSEEKSASRPSETIAHDAVGGFISAADFSLSSVFHFIFMLAAASFLNCYRNLCSRHSRPRRRPHRRPHRRPCCRYRCIGAGSQSQTLKPFIEFR